MFYRAHSFPLVISFVLAYSPFAITDDSVIVYNNSETATHSVNPYGYAPDGFFAFNFFVDTSLPGFQSEPMGDEIKLEGPQREITRFDLILLSTEPIELENLTLTLHDEHPDSDHSPAFDVGPSLWTYTKHDIVVNGNEIVTPVTFEVPNVEVPEMFVWTVVTDDFSQKVGLATYDLPTVGVNPEWIDPPYYPEPTDYFYRYESSILNDWTIASFGDDPEANFGAIVWAVPEPTVTGSFLLGGLLVSWRRKRG